MVLTIHEGELEKADVQELLRRHVAAMHAHSPPEACHVLPAASLADPAITFFSVREDDHLLAVGALKALGLAEGEIKSMRTADQSLRRGAASAILKAIVDEARQRFYRRLLLETGSTQSFAAALALYARAGFVPAEPFGGYAASPFTRFLALDL